jgi:hypothetical protein
MDQEPRFARPPPPSASSPIAPQCCGPLGAVLAEQHDESDRNAATRLDILAKSRLIKITNDHPADQEVTMTAITA